MTCLETTFLIDLLKGKKEILAVKERLMQSKEPLFIAAPSIMEVWAGALRKTSSKSEREKTLALFANIDVLPLDAKSSREAGELLAELLDQGLPIDPVDVLIAAIAKTNNETLLTRDAHYTRIPGLRVLKY
jgi:tRNA(fMet)-specific endonuclease VapC